MNSHRWRITRYIPIVLLAALNLDGHASQVVSRQCASEKRMLDTGSIRPSNGKWQLVRDSAGKPVAADSDEMLLLAYAYTSTCFVESNITIARQLLEVWANSHHDVGKKAAASHCTLAEWYRQGIGGAKDEATAVQWEQRFKTETKGHSCELYRRKEPIDPRDPWNLKK